VQFQSFREEEVAATAASAAAIGVFGRAARICRQQAVENPRGKLRKTRATRR